MWQYIAVRVVEYIGNPIFYLYGVGMELYDIDGNILVIVMYQQRKETKNNMRCIIELTWK
jgi:hypothetical protein